MSDIGQSLAAFARLTREERERCLHLINAYNEALAESRSPHGGGSIADELFSREEIEQLVKNFRANKLSAMGPSMQRYLSLLDRGWRWPVFE